MEDPWTRVISPEPNGDKVSLIFTNIYNVSYDGVQEIEATRIGAPDDAESVLESKFSQDYRPLEILPSDGLTPCIWKG